MPLIIMISGFRGSGKDTLGSLIIKHRKFKRYGFADQLKDIASKKYNFDRKYADLREEKDKLRPEYNNQSIRDLVRKESQEIEKTNSKMLSEEVLNKMKEDIKNDPEINFVITDFRYKHDYEPLEEYFGKKSILTIKINRIGIEIPNEEKEPEEYALKHFEFDIYIQNDSSIEELWINFDKKIKI
jgi:dephospho-CoA kinase